MTQTTQILLLALGAYLLGSLPFGYWVALRVKGVDIRTVGSGNIGSTNVSRVCGPVAGGIVWFLDVLKGFVPPPGRRAFWAALGVPDSDRVLRHSWTQLLHFSRFQRRQGNIYQSRRACSDSAPPVGVAVGLVWVAFTLTLRYISVASIAAALSLLVFMPITYPGDTPRLLFACVACFMAVYKHRANIQRLRDGREPKINLPWTKRSPQTAPASAEAADETDEIKEENPVNAAPLIPLIPSRITPTACGKSLRKPMSPMSS